MYDLEKRNSLSELYLPVSGQRLGDMTALGLFHLKANGSSHRDDERFRFGFLQILHKDEETDTTNPIWKPAIGM
jgi:hypothetical protein